MTTLMAVLLHALVMGAVPWGVGPGSEGAVRPLQVRQIVLAAAPMSAAVAATPPAPTAEAPVAPTPATTPPPPAEGGPVRPRPDPEPATAPEPRPEPEPEPSATEPAAPAEAAEVAASAPQPVLATAPEPEAARVLAAASPATSRGTPPLENVDLEMTGGAPLPVYATRPAPPATLRFELRRGGLRGTGELVWRPRPEGYSLAMRGTAFSLNIIEWTSEGGFDSAGLAPVRYVDRRRARDARAANFQRDKGQITFSGPATVYPLVPGAQDRVSWMLQLPAIVAAAPAVFVPGERIGIFVVGARGDAEVWTFTVEGREAVDLPAGRIETTLRLRREPRKPFDTRVDVWLDPARHHLPVRLRLSSVEAGDGNEFLLESMTLQP